MKTLVAAACRPASALLLALSPAIGSAGGAGPSPAPNGEAPRAANAEAPRAANAEAPRAAAAPSGPLIAPEREPRPGDAQRRAGAALASQGGGAGVPACATCHGAGGEGDPQAGAPRIAGQSWEYLLHELDSYANGARAHPVMGPIAKAMTAAQRTDSAAHFAALQPPVTTAVAAAPASAGPGGGTVSGAGTQAAPGNVRGRLLAVFGDESRWVQGCANCHGPDGIGSGRGYPALAGQHAAYLVNTLKAWRDGTRHNDPSGQMTAIAKALSDEDVQAVAAYYSALPAAPRAPQAADAAARAAPSSAGAAVVSGPRGGGDAVQGVGAQQPGPVTGGAQGQGPGNAAAPGRPAGGASAASGR